ncbi:toxin-antitoxin system HicB family antitoxin [Legionella israelensis]
MCKQENIFSGKPFKGSFNVRIGKNIIWGWRMT